MLAWIGRVYGVDVASGIATTMEHRARDWWQDEFSALAGVGRTYPCGEAPKGFAGPPQCSYP